MAMVYKATCLVSGKAYVGFTMRPLAERRAEHENAAAKGSRFAFGRALRKYGFDAFSWEILAEGSRAEMLQAENHYVLLFRTLVPAGYNLTTGGDAPEFSQLSRDRMSASQTVYQNDPAVRAAASEKTHRQFAQSGAREKVSAGNRRRFGDPAEVEANRLRLQAYWAVPENRAKGLAALLSPEALQKRRENQMTSPAVKAGHERRRAVTPEQAANICMLVALGATLRATGEWFGISHTSVRFVVEGRNGYADRVQKVLAQQNQNTVP